VSDRIEVVATVNLPGLRRGQVAIVDPDVPYVADALAARHVVPTGRQRDPTADYEADPTGEKP
jgi:hypothetical protein